jgi:hypothetical protein
LDKVVVALERLCLVETAHIPPMIRLLLAPAVLSVS